LQFSLLNIFCNLASVLLHPKTLLPTVQLLTCQSNSSEDVAIDHSQSRKSKTADWPSYYYCNPSKPITAKQIIGDSQRRRRLQYLE